MSELYIVRSRQGLERFIGSRDECEAFVRDWCYMRYCNACSLQHVEPVSIYQWDHDGRPDGPPSRPWFTITALDASTAGVPADV